MPDVRLMVEEKERLNGLQKKQIYINIWEMFALIISEPINRSIIRFRGEINVAHMWFLLIYSNELGRMLAHVKH